MTTLHHRPQRHLYGCMYHAIFAFTGDLHWLEHVDDLSEPRWLSRLHAAGATVLTYYADLMTDTRAAPAFWQKLREHMPEESKKLPLLVTCDGLGGLRHLVALEFHRDGSVAISDSALSGLRAMTFLEFLRSNYSSASMVQQLMTADVDAYPHESGAEFVSRTDSAPYAPM